MLVVEKTRHIRAKISGEGTAEIINIIKTQILTVEIIDDSEDLVEWNVTDIAKDIKAKKTPGKLLRAYRESAGLTMVELADAVGTKYPNISAMENDRRVIGLRAAQKFARVLKVDYTKFLAGT